jgi:hypothetical protein
LKYDIHALTEESNAIHLLVVIGNTEWLKDYSEHSYTKWKILSH